MRLFLPFLFVITVTNANKKDIKSEAISKAHFEFSLDLYKTLMVNNRTDNLVVSPYSINLVLSMLFLGTIDVSNTSRQLRSIMHLKGASYVDIHNGFKNIVSNFDQNYYRTKMKIGKTVIKMNLGILCSSDLRGYQVLKKKSTSEVAFMF